MSSINVFKGNTVRITLNDGRECYGVSKGLMEIRAISHIRLVPFSPLTSRFLGGHLVEPTELISKIEPVKLPVDDYALDFDHHAYFGCQGDTTAFRTGFCDFVLQANLLKPEVDLETMLRRSQLTDLGLDFARQHFPLLRNLFVRFQVVPKIDDLSSRLAVTIENRTSDIDWAALSNVREGEIAEKLVLDGFYKNPIPTFALHALDSLLIGKSIRKRPDLIFMFARIGEAYPKAAQLFPRLQSQFKDDDEVAIIQSIMCPKELRVPNIIERPADLDLCWAEFLVTGAVQSLDPVVKTLDWPDISRDFINHSLRIPESPVAVGKDGLTELEHLGLRFEPDYQQITGAEDVDIRLSKAFQVENETAQRIVRHFSEDHRLYMETKSAALSSLISKCASHERVRRLCENAATQLGGDARRLLATRVR